MILVALFKRCLSLSRTTLIGGDTSEKQIKRCYMYIAAPFAKSLKFLGLTSDEKFLLNLRWCPLKNIK